MHVPDGFLDAPTTLATGALAAASVPVALRGARRELGERTAPLGGLVAAFVFAAQLISFPIAAGTNAHLLGGVLAAVLVGPNTALLCTTVVLLAQVLVLAYGGVTGLGASMIVMDLVPIVVGYAAFLLVRRLCARSPGGLAAAAGVGAFVSVPAGAAAFAGLYVLGGAAGIPLRTVATAVVLAHLVVGGCEAVITALVVRGLLAARPDLVRAARIGPFGPAVPVVGAAPAVATARPPRPAAEPVGRVGSTGSGPDPRWSR
ncbi:MAG TPA: energy-coupling factor ABC transporter permease [Mycobacteriales bacterium]|nr:energy-coupling factor ABC transporter permease [Mycobacteriales bacterium]